MMWIWEMCSGLVFYFFFICMIINVVGLCFVVWTFKWYGNYRCGICVLVGLCCGWTSHVCGEMCIESFLVYEQYNLLI
ncbi:putative inactive histone-lysine N-methyltransferase SUVR1 isoform X1 [Iris pallida]|uniref:Inactive histone-lysine N-methyltransferase SUVR1 isoform X1 n=1 Tax=Iris pallida TaxID=29817 RepID=A0AAX6GHI2_IRIPA|nr:putative inactive histone-lysine N-methyltransferase SUVR1 isoform X1 [Iris pallida]